MNKENNEELPEFIANRIKEIEKYQNKELTFPLTEPVDIWSLEAKRIFPNSLTLQKAFNEIKKQKLTKRKNL